MSTEVDETARTYQARLVVLFKLMFWALVALLAFVWFQYALYPTIAPTYRNYVYLGSSISLGIMALLWRVVLVRMTLELRWLHVIDFIYSLGVGASFGASALLQYDVRPAGYMSLLYSAATVFARALVLPSSARRTAVASSLTFLPMTIAAFALSVTTTQDLPGPSYFFGFLLLGVVPIVLATIGSHIIYDLRRKITTAQQLGSYKLDQKIGEGGMGAVYRAHHIMLRRHTAVKLLPPDRVGGDMLARFEREVRAMSQLSHPNTVAVYDYGRSPEGLFYYAMEYLGGGIDLEKLVNRHGKLPSGRVVPILVQVCGALQEAHERGIVHRDIKPANIILCERGGMPDVAKVVDYGLVKEIKDAEAGASTQIIVGTPHYLAPEAVTDPGQVSPAMDLYALGCVAYFLVTGKRVFDAKALIEVCLMHVRDEPVPPSQHVAIAPELEQILLRCLAKQPAQRFASAAALAEALRALPPADDWTTAHARAWWLARQRATEAEVVASSLETRTIRVDLGTREPAA